MLAPATASEVAAAARRVYGATLEDRGLIHLLAVWQGDRGRLVELEPLPDAPGSRHGAFLRGLARARADAILTTGAMLRRMPALDHRLGKAGGVSAALAEWRRERLAKRQPPVTLVLTSDPGVDLDHPVFRHWTRPVVYTTRQAQWELESRAADRGVELVGVDEPTAAGAVEFLRQAFGAATVVLETGSGPARELYGPPAGVDEVLLSIYQGPEVAAGALGELYLSAEQLTRRFRERSRPFRVAAASGEWSFQRFRR